jgi:chromosomal replication initiation ATPase DnaA
MSEDQPRLFDYAASGADAGSFIVSPSNALAAALVSRWRAWPGGAVALYGPKGAGKSHLLRAWAEEADAALLDPGAGAGEARAAFEARGGRVGVDDMDGPRDDAAAMALLDLARERGGAVLVVGRPPPSEWPVTLMDLRSRFAGMLAARLDDPDQALLQGVIQRLCRRRFIELRDNVAKYIAENGERSFEAAQDLVEELDRMMISGRRPVAYDLAAEALRRVARRRARDSDRVGDDAP